MAADAGPNLLVVFLGVTHLVKLRLPKQITGIRWLGRTTLRATKISLNNTKKHFPEFQVKYLTIKMSTKTETKHVVITHGGRQHGSSKPDSVPLHVVRDDLHVDGFGLQHKDVET